jgi:hypothetical protein
MSKLPIRRQTKNSKPRILYPAIILTPVFCYSRGFLFALHGHRQKNNLSCMRLELLGPDHKITKIAKFIWLSLEIISNNSLYRAKTAKTDGTWTTMTLNEILGVGPYIPEGRAGRALYIQI